MWDLFKDVHLIVNDASVINILVINGLRLLVSPQGNKTGRIPFKLPKEVSFPSHRMEIYRRDSGIVFKDAVTQQVYVKSPKLSK